MATATTVKPAAPAEILARDAITLRDVDWETYCQLRDEPANYHIRMAYLDGTLTLMSPEFIHDEGAESLGLLIRGVTSGLGLTVKGIRTTTLRRGTARRKGGGKEPDNAFYLGENERLMRNARKKGKLDLDVDPPPDLAIEVDHKADSSRALKLYARIGVPELWRYKTKAKALWFGRLAGDHYESIDRSLNLPRLTPSLVLQALDESDRISELEWKIWLRDWARELPESP